MIPKQPTEPPPEPNAYADPAACALDESAPAEEQEDAPLPFDGPLEDGEAEPSSPRVDTGEYAYLDRVVTPEVYGELMQIHTRLGVFLYNLPIHRRNDGEPVAAAEAATEAGAA